MNREDAREGQSAWMGRTTPVGGNDFPTSVWYTDDGKVGRWASFVSKTGTLLIRGM